MKRLLLITLFLISRDTLHAQTCNCEKTPWVPHKPCFEQCSNQLLSQINKEGLVYIGVSDTVADKFMGVRHNYRKPTLANYKWKLTGEEYDQVEKGLKKIDKKEATIEAVMSK